MIRSLTEKFSFCRRIKVFSFIYLNHFCKSVIRADKSKIIPYKNAVIDIDKTAKIYIKDGDIEIGCDLLKKSKAETRLRLRDGAVFSSEGGCKISYGSTLEILQDAVLAAKFFTMNSNSVLVTAKKITLGNDVMIARNVVLYDSDFHSVLDEQGAARNLPEPVEIGNHVWIGTNVTVLKGTKIGAGSVIGAGIVISENVPENVIKNRDGIKPNKNGWSRKSPSLTGQ